MKTETIELNHNALPDATIILRRTGKFWLPWKIRWTNGFEISNVCGVLKTAGLEIDQITPAILGGK